MFQNNIMQGRLTTYSSIFFMLVVLGTKGLRRKVCHRSSAYFAVDYDGAHQYHWQDACARDAAGGLVEELGREPSLLRKINQALFVYCCKVFGAACGSCCIITKYQVRTFFLKLCRLSIAGVHLRLLVL